MYHYICTKFIAYYILLNILLNEVNIRNDHDKLPMRMFESKAEVNFSSDLFVHPLKETNSVHMYRTFCSTLTEIFLRIETSVGYRARFPRVSCHGAECIFHGATTKLVVEVVSNRDQTSHLSSNY